MNRIDAIKSDLNIIDGLKELAREHLLAFLSEARDRTLKLQVADRSKLMDQLSAEFHPDGNITDLFADGFFGITDDLEDEVAEIECRAERAHERSVRQAAE